MASIRWVGGLLVAAILAGACSIGEALADWGDPVDLRPADLVGTWQSGGGRRSITFAEDGAFTAKNLPYDAFDGLVPTGPPSKIDGAGTWTLDPGLTLHFTELAGESKNMTGPDLSPYRQEDGSVWLFFFYDGQGGNSWTAYEKDG